MLDPTSDWVIATTAATPTPTLEPKATAPATCRKSASLRACTVTVPKDRPESVKRALEDPPSSAESTSVRLITMMIDPATPTPFWPLANAMPAEKLKKPELSSALINRLSASSVIGLLPPRMRASISFSLSMTTKAPAMPTAVWVPDAMAPAPATETFVVPSTARRPMSVPFSSPRPSIEARTITSSSKPMAEPDSANPPLDAVTVLLAPLPIWSAAPLSVKAPSVDATEPPTFAASPN